METKLQNTRIVNGILIVIFCGCIWIGWSDYEFIKPDISQEEIRETIRHSVRTAAQIAVQFIIPVIILGCLVKNLLNRKEK